MIGLHPIYPMHTRGTPVAKNPAIERNMDNICIFDKRFRALKGARDIGGLRDLAQWANDQGLTLGRKALEAAEELQK